PPIVFPIEEETEAALLPSFSSLLIATAIRWADQEKEGKGRRLGRARVLFLQVVLLKTALEACRLSSSEAIMPPKRRGRQLANNNVMADSSPAALLAAIQTLQTEMANIRQANEETEAALLPSFSSLLIATAIRWADQEKEGKGRRLGRARVLFVQVVLLKTALEACRLSSSEASNVAVVIHLRLNKELEESSQPPQQMKLEVRSKLVE
ncbi:hypothetical protein EJB05_00837, partial [Eragrostis curvula]